MNGAEVPPQLLESMEATVAREIAEERALDKVRNTRWSDRVELHRQMAAQEIWSLARGLGMLVPAISTST